MRAPVITVARHRIHTDGQGVTSLVGFHGCPLRCKWCLNPFSFAPDTKYTPMTPEMLYEKVKIDELYFLATGGGVTFGGGEPLLYANFLKQFRQICGDEWHLSAETSLAVPWENVQTATQCINSFIIDIKDTDPDIYHRYTGKENHLMMNNLEKLTKIIPPERITVRLPLIPDFNSEAHRQKSFQILSARGLTQFDFLTYKKQPH
ncbi:MAG: radical SAM protein [Clostridia bacterium]|nr:radical SAM protein [Clostridia bacterium]